MEQVLSHPVAGALWAVLGIILGAALAIQWGRQRGRALGRSIGRWLPGDQVERWLLEFLAGLADGLRDTMGAGAVNVERDQGQEGRTFLRIQLRADPTGKVVSRSVEVPSSSDTTASGGTSEAGGPSS